MRNFPEHTDLGNGYSWTATFDSHDWARHFNFYFTLKLYRHGIGIRTLGVTMDDKMYGDKNCKFSNEQIAEYVHAVLNTKARQAINSSSDVV